MVGQELSLQPQPSDLPGNGPIEPPDRYHQSYSSDEEYHDCFCHNSFPNVSERLNNQLKPAPTTGEPTLLVGAGFIPARKEPIVLPALESFNLDKRTLDAEKDNNFNPTVQVEDYSDISGNGVQKT